MKYIEQLEAKLKTGHEELAAQKAMRQTALNELEGIICHHDHVMKAVREYGLRVSEEFRIREGSKGLAVERLPTTASGWRDATTSEIAHVIDMLEKDHTPAA